MLLAMGILSALLALVGISILVIVHESGHYLVAKAFGMRVETYSIGLGPTLFKHQPEGSPTTFQVAAIPFLAYVQIAGMNPFEDIDHEDPALFPNKGLFARIMVIFAGPLANYLFASIVVFFLALSGHFQQVVAPVEIAEVQEDSAAEQAGLRVGDQIIEANGEEIEDFAELIAATSPRAGESTEYVVLRDGRRLAPISITPRDVDGRGVIGVVPLRGPAYQDLGSAAYAAVLLPYNLTMLQIDGIGDMIRRRTSEGLVGPVGMFKETRRRAEKGASELLQMLVMLSVALGLFNLLPFPALDGGRLLFLVYELITRRRPNPKVEAAIHTVGILFLLGVLVLVTFRDSMS